METTKHFVLVHGICLGAWCWYKLATILKLGGHKVTALDLGASGVNPKRLDEIVSISDYLEPLMELLASLPPHEKVVLVGHSYGGISISLAMEKFPEKILVALFISAYMPDWKQPPGTLIQQFFDGTTMESFLDCQFGFDQNLKTSSTSAIFGQEYMKMKVYQPCEQEDLELAKTLVRPSRLFKEELIAPEFLLTEAKYGSIRRVYIICEHDEVMRQEFQRLMVDNCPPEEVKLVKCGHMIMISKPKELSHLLEEIAGKCNYD